MDDSTLTMFIICPCGIYDEIKDVRVNDIAHAKWLARTNGWHHPKINQGALVNGRLTAKGICKECYDLELNG